MKLSMIALSLVVGLSACESYAAGHALAPVSEANGILVDENGLLCGITIANHSQRQ